jgi:uncharacterized RDD family membrane protein YckC
MGWAGILMPQAAAARQSSLIIETPEGVRFSYELASPAVRVLAWSIDAAVIAWASYALGKLTQAINLVSPDIAVALGGVSFFAFWMAYAIVLEWRWRGQTLGKRVLRLRVIDAHGLRLQLSQIAIRNLLRVVDGLPLLYLVGGIAAFLNRKGQRLGDLAANTVVAIERTGSQPDLDQIAPARYNSLVAWPHLAARLRTVVGPDAVSIAVRAIDGRDGYDPAARVELFRELASYFRSLVPFPPEAVEGLTDEQYVRSALRVIYGREAKSA